MDMNSDLHEKENAAAKDVPEETGPTKTEAAGKDTTEEDSQSVSALRIGGRKIGLRLFFLNIRYHKTWLYCSIKLPHMAAKRNSQ